MRERHLGSSGLVVSVVGLGCNNMGWRIDEAQARAVVDAALDAGITLFDTAESYGRGDSEVFLGRALAGRRDRAVIATKFGWGTGRGDNSVPRGDPGYVAVQTIPGVGPTLAAVFVAEIGDVTRFPGPAQLTSWAGLTPRHHESDTTVRRGRITKQGSKLVRWAAIEAVQHVP